jgi:UDP-3-O-[3-hydroxymyristoyl] glucosamine N-acyltransferase
MKNKKYKLIKSDKSGLYRIKALKDFTDVKIGDIGGYVESEDNLSHEGSCWVYNDAQMFGNATMSGNAFMFGNAVMSGKAQMFGNATMSGNAVMFGYAQMSGNARISGNACMFGNARIFGNAVMSGNARIFGNAVMSGNARMSRDAQMSGSIRISGSEHLSDTHITNYTQFTSWSFLNYAVTITKRSVQIGCTNIKIKNLNKEFIILCTKYDIDIKEAKKYLSIIKALYTLLK